MKFTLRTKCTGGGATSFGYYRTFARSSAYPSPFANTNTDFGDRITHLVIKDGFAICIKYCFAFYMGEVAFNLHLPIG